MDAMYVLGNIGYGNNGYHVSRNLSIGDFAGHSQSNDQGNLLNLGLETGYAMQAGDFTATPLIGVQYLNMRNDAYSEIGAGPANLIGSAQTQQSLFGSLGSRFSYCSEYRGLQIQTNAQARYLHDVLADNRDSLVQFAGGGSPFLVLGTRTGQSFVWAGAGVGIGGERARFALDYTNLSSSKQVTHMGTGSVEVRW